MAEAIHVVVLTDRPTLTRPALLQVHGTRDGPRCLPRGQGVLPRGDGRRRAWQCHHLRSRAPPAPPPGRRRRPRPAAARLTATLLLICLLLPPPLLCAPLLSVCLGHPRDLRSACPHAFTPFAAAGPERGDRGQLRRGLRGLQRRFPRRRRPLLRQYLR